MIAKGKLKTIIYEITKRVSTGLETFSGQVDLDEQLGEVEERHWAEALTEFEGESRRPGVWAKALVLAEGNETEARTKYLKWRVLEIYENDKNAMHERRQISILRARQEEEDKNKREAENRQKKLRENLIKDKARKAQAMEVIYQLTGRRFNNLINEENCLEIIDALGFSVTKSQPGVWVITVPGKGKTFCYDVEDLNRYILFFIQNMINNPEKE